jgi:hypothetical protein
MRISVVAACLAVALPCAAREGKWTPEQVVKLDAKELAGLELLPEKLWDPKTGTGLLAATVNLSGCSGAFVSKDGLVVTNHHCVFSIVAEHATPQKDLIADGFVAPAPAAELPGKGQRLRVPRAFTDVTKIVLGAIPDGADDVARWRAIDATQKAIVKQCEAQPATRCDVSAYWGGLKYVLVEQTEITDVRLVYAPPRAVGEYGGEIDNWMWPRHTGDFALVRAYQDGKPYQPAAFMKVATKGVQPGDFVMVVGYPGTTWRELLAEEMALRAERWFPAVAAWSRELIAILEAVDDPAGRIAVASQLKALHNRAKNADGQLAGVARGRRLEKKRAADDAVLAWAKTKPDMKDALAARDQLLAELATQGAKLDRELLLAQIPSTSKALAMAVAVARLAREGQKPDAERDPAYMDRERPRLKEQLERDQKSLFVPADKLLLRAWLQRARALPAGARIASVDAVFGAAKDDKALTKKIDALYAKTKVTNAAQRKAMAEENPIKLAERRDPLLDFALALAEDLEAQKREEDRRAGFSARVRPVWMETVLAAANKPVAPDANRTLRVTFATVKGYEPRDGVVYQPQTRISGLLEKMTGKEPFVVPTKVLDAIGRNDFGRWIDPKLGEVPVCFLADADTTGGNSGSPVVNGRGELVGLNFDRVWENVANDFGYDAQVARNVNVDVRYMLWMLDRVERAGPLLDELGAR